MGTEKASLVTGGIRLRYEKTTHNINVEVTLGSPGAGCSGVGICQVIAAADKTCNCPTVSARAGWTRSNRLQLAFLKASMTEKIIRRHFRWRLFQILESYQLPEKISRHLQQKNLRIEPGIYTVWETDDRLIVEF